MIGFLFYFRNVEFILFCKGNRRHENGKRSNQNEPSSLHDLCSRPPHPPLSPNFGERINVGGNVISVFLFSQ
jgi:hypothetical protein